MDRVHNSKNDRIYEIYRACRLCGAGAGYKMPIIQSAVDLEVGVELRQKIKECVRIEVNHTDRMPPLICEMCVDKLNAFYDFMRLCHRTDQLTRRQLGLPLKTKASDSTYKDKENVEWQPLPLEEIETLPSLKLRIKKTRRELKKIRKIDKMRKIEKMIKSKIVHRPSPSRLPSRESSATSEDLRPRRTRATPGGGRGGSDSESDASPHTDTTRLKRPREKETKDTPPPTKKLRIPFATSRPGPRSSKVPREVDEPAAKPLTRETSKNTGPKETIPKPTKELTKSTASKDLISKLFIKIPPSKIAAKELTSRSTPSKTTAREVTKSKPKDTTKPTPKYKGPKQKQTSKSTQHEPTSKETAAKATSKETAAKATSKETAAKATSKETAAKVTSKEPTPPEAPKVFVCVICEMQFKTMQGLAIHNNYKHLPTFTNPKLACDACEEWFVSGESAAAHHRTHRVDNVPYKCTRCYGYYKLMREYHDHFGLGECLSLYEVPDVKCWDCWRMFPTTRLLDTHKCGGEDARPGGKCKKCSRVYSLLKSLTRHEISCTYRRKGEVRISPEVQARLRPCEVRVARCDDLLRGGGGGGDGGRTTDVAGVPHTHGLDSKAHYPYLEGSKSNPSSHMVSIDQDIKDEFSAKGGFLDDDSDTDSQRTVDSLSNISRKIILLQTESEHEKCKLKSEDETDIGRKINSIIDNLTFEDHNSCGYDSDGVFDKNEKTTLDAKVNDCLGKDNNCGKDDMTSCSDTDSVKGRNASVGKVSAGGIIDGKEKSDSTDDKIHELTEKSKGDKVQIDKMDKLHVTEVSEADVKLDGATEIDSATDKSDAEQQDASLDVTKQMDVESSIPSEAANEESNAEVNEKSEPSNDVSMDTDESDGANVSVSKENDRIGEVDAGLNEQSRVNDSSIEVVASGNDKLESINQLTDTEVKINETESEIMDVDQNERTDSTQVSVNYDIDVKNQPSPSIEDFSKIDEITNKILQETESQDENHTKDETISEARTADDTTRDQGHIADNIIEGESTGTHTDSNNDSQESDSNVFTDRDATEKDGGSSNDMNHFKDESCKAMNGDQDLDKSDVPGDGEGARGGIEADPAGGQALAENEDKVNENVKTTNHFIDDLLKKPENIRSLELEAVSDEEFDFN